MPTDTSEPFSQMAELIKHNEGKPFGGACVIVPPGDGNPINIVQFSSGTGTEAQFWTSIVSLAQAAVAEIDAKKQIGRTFGVR